MDDGSLVTPKSNAILPSITRRSLMEIAASGLKMKTEERPIALRTEFPHFKEVAACGTAAVLSPVGRIWFDDAWHDVGDNPDSVGPVMQQLYDELVGIQNGERPDSFGWLHESEL